MASVFFGALLVTSAVAGAQDGGGQQTTAVPTAAMAATVTPATVPLGPVTEHPVDPALRRHGPSQSDGAMRIVVTVLPAGHGHRD